MVASAEPRGARAKPVHAVRVRVKGGYQPSVIHARVGEPIRIVFSREESAPCSEHVVFPSFGKTAMLPPFEDVALELVPEHAGDYEFTCQLGMLRGLLVVADQPGGLPIRNAAGATSPGSTSHSLADELGDSALLAFVALLCCLPLLLLVSVPVLGWRVGGLLAVAWLGVATTFCFAVCVRRVRVLRVPPDR